MKKTTNGPSSVASLNSGCGCFLSMKAPLSFVMRGLDPGAARSRPAANTAVILRCSPQSGEPRRMGHKRPRPSFETPRKCAAPQDDGSYLEAPGVEFHLSSGNALLDIV